MRPSYITLTTVALISLIGGCARSTVSTENQSGAAQQRSDFQQERQGVTVREAAATDASGNSLPGSRQVSGHIKQIRSDQIEIDIGHLQSLSVPLKMATDKGQRFKPGDEILVTMNDHNAVVDYHHPNEQSHHRVMRGKLTTPLTVGLDKAVVQTDEGIRTFLVAERAKGKLTAMPVGPEILFMTDETGLLVDAQLASLESVQESSENNKARIKGAHQQVRAIYEGLGGEDRIKIAEEGMEREVAFRPPLPKLERLKPGQEIILLMDDQDYVLEIATPDVPPVR